MPKDPRIKKVLVIGSGPIIIGQAAEFDYSGTQACRALKAEGIETVLLNSNPATIMTDPDVADHVYIEPMTLEVVERILDIEKPDSVLPNLGGQMGLNLSMELARSGYLDRTGIRLLACKPETIDRAEDRELFKETMEKLHQPIIPSEVVETLQDALACDGLLLPGGGDIDPKFYGQERIPACGEPNVLRDTAEPLLLRAFLAADKPVLAICRGIQLMNVALGGDLYQDIKPFAHVPHNDHWGKIHTVTVRRDTLLSRILGQDTVLVNSQHHQAASRVAPGLEIAALSEDGFIEALEKPDATFCLGVQWHPEWLSDADPAQQGLFGAFVEACKG